MGETYMIPVYGGHVAIVDREDFERFGNLRWHRSCKGYAARAEKKPEGGYRTVFMHRMILCPAEGMFVDHINGNKLDNRKANLRQASNAENCRAARNRVKHKNLYRGVYWKQANRKWEASVTVDGKRTYLGLFHTAEQARDARNIAAKRLHGEFFAAA